MAIQHCFTCELAKRRETGNAPLWDDIYRTQHWYVVHSYNTALAGWLVIICKLHIAGIDEMTEAEAIELGTLLRRVSVALRDVVDCEKTYVAQFAEAQGHHHVHFHVIPRMADQPQERKGPGIFSYLGVSEGERISEARMDEIAAQVRYRLVELETEPNEKR